MDGLTKTLEMYFVKKAPALPKSVKELLVKLAPWIEIVGLIFTIPAIMALLGFSAMMYGTPYGGYFTARTGYGFSLPVLFLIASFVLMLLAIPGLFKRTAYGWNYVYYAVILNAVYALFSFNWFSLIVGTIIAFYFLFQVKSYYK